MGLLESMAGQAAIAIENATLMDEVQKININLRSAYDATIEGWACSIDLRNGDSDQHSKRVADLSVELAQTAGYQGEGLLSLRRGALLHDIGKLGVPDAILLNPGPINRRRMENYENPSDHCKNGFLIRLTFYNRQLTFLIAIMNAGMARDILMDWPERISPLQPECLPWWIVGIHCVQIVRGEKPGQMTMPGITSKQIPAKLLTRRSLRSSGNCWVMVLRHISKQPAEFLLYHLFAIRFVYLSSL